MTSSLSRTEMPVAQIARAQTHGRLILTVFENSPAAHLGLGPGWAILKVNGRKADRVAIVSAELDLEPRTLLLSDPDGAVWTATDVPWPFGMVATPWPGKTFYRQIGRGDIDHEDLTRFWEAGALQVYPSMIAPLRNYLTHPFRRTWNLIRSEAAARAAIARSEEYPALGVLAFAYACDEQWDEAQFFLEAARASRVRANQASYSRLEIALDAYTESLIAEAGGDMDEALELASHAKHIMPDVWEVERRLASLEDRTPELAVPKWTNEAFPIDYDLPAHDPIGEMKYNIGRIGFREILETLAPAEFLVVLVLGAYRSNYYYNNAMERLAILRRAFPGTIREVHVITSGRYALDASHRKHSEGFALRHELPFVILWDENDIVSTCLEPDGSPAAFVVDQTGRILATEGLMDEEGYWKARHRLASAP